jgi:putative FmdB family regulatory protein
MPIYEYECESCRQIFETNQRITDPPLTECPECHGTLHKLISRTSFQLKGTGWYATDYRKDSDAIPDAASKGQQPPPKSLSDVDKEIGKRKSYLEQTPAERKSTIKEITNKVANRMP